MRTFVCHRNAEFYSVANSAVVLCHDVSYAAAESALVGAGVKDAKSILDNPVAAEQWLPVYNSATQSAIDNLQSNTATREDIGTLRAGIEAVFQLNLELVDDLRQQKRAAELQAAKDEFNAEWYRLKTALVNEGNWKPEFAEIIDRQLLAMPVGERVLKAFKDMEGEANGKA